MLNGPAPTATPERAPPLAGVLIGTAISLVLWAMIAGTVLILR